jgi:hypothetical protein
VTETRHRAQRGGGGTQTLAGIVTALALGAGCTTTDTEAPVHRLDDVPMTCTPENRLYQLLSIDPAVRVANRLDVDGDGRMDDELGRAHDAITSIDPQFAVAPRFVTRLANDVPWLVSVDRCGDEARVSIDRGVQIGAGSSGLWISGQGPRAVGTLRDGLLIARDGTASVPLTALADALSTATTAGWTPSEGLVIRATASDTGYVEVLEGVFATTIDPDIARARLAPPIAAFLTAQSADDWMRSGADSDHDGIVTATELEASPTFRGLIAGDVTVIAPDGTPRTDLPQSSLAIAFTAVRIR